MLTRVVTPLPVGPPVGETVAGWSPRDRPGRLPLVGRTCRLEPIEPAHHAGGLLRAYADDDALWTYLRVGPFATEAELAGWLTGLVATPDLLPFAILDSAGREVGVASFLRIAPNAGSIEIGWLTFSRALRGTTASTEAIALLLAEAFDALGYRRVEWKCDALNAASRRTAERIGFTYEGTHRQALVVRGRNRDTAWLSILDGEWPALRAGLHAWLDPANFDAAGVQRQSLTACRAA